MMVAILRDFRSMPVGLLDLQLSGSETVSSSQSAAVPTFMWWALSNRVRRGGGADAVPTA